MNSPTKRRRRHVATGKPSRGESHHSSRLTEAQVTEIILAPWDVRHVTLAERYGVHERSIRSIRKGLAWKHVYRRVMYVGLAA